MKKKETKKSGIGTIIIILLALCFLILLIWGFTTGWTFEDKPEFTIKKMNCYNQTRQIGEKAVGEPYLVTYNYKIKIYDSEGDFDEYCLSEYYLNNTYPNCVSNYCHYNYWEECFNSELFEEINFCYSVEAEIFKENCTETYQDFEPIFDTRLFCELVEVDEKDFYCDFECGKLPKDANINACVGFCLSSSIPKIDLDWLERNCECEVCKIDDKIFDEENKYYCNNRFKGDLPLKYQGCQKYKCGEYHIKVK